MLAAQQATRQDGKVVSGFLDDLDESGIFTDEEIYPEVAEELAVKSRHVVFEYAGVDRKCRTIFQCPTRRETFKGSRFLFSFS